jgi:prepilin-type N-terminal cleavage/methylation domain-containing protein
MMRRLLHAEGGFTLIEMALSMAITSLILATVVSVFYSFSQNAADSTKAAELHQTLTSIGAAVVLELREAVPVDQSGNPVQELGPDRLEFTTDRAEVEGPERIVYERVNCDADGCQFRVQRFAAVPGTGPDWQFSTEAYEDAVLVEGMVASGAVFRGFEWVGDPVEITPVSQCGDGYRSCDFPLVEVRLRAVPMPVSDGASVPVEIVEEVRLRNAA